MASHLSTTTCNFTYPWRLTLFLQLISQYSARGRTGVVAPFRDVEAYLLPACSLTERLLAAARSAAVPQAEALLPAGGGNQIGPEQLMLAIIHRRVSA